jgi:hypothetical protein
MQEEDNHRFSADDKYSKLRERPPAPVPRGQSYNGSGTCPFIPYHILNDKKFHFTIPIWCVNKKAQQYYLGIVLDKSTQYFHILFWL